MAHTVAEDLNNRILAEGIIVLVDLAGNRFHFYPRDKHMPLYLWNELKNDDHKKLLLRNFLVNLGRL